MRYILSLVVLFASVAVALADVVYSSGSVLSSGTWRKISVSESGIYALSASELASMGFTDPSRVRLYGQGGVQQTYIVGQDSRDDLYLMPVVHTSDGLLFYAEGPDGWTRNSDGSYIPSFNYFTKQAYYYLTTGDESDEASTAVGYSGTTTDLTTYTNRLCHAARLTNLDSSGREWVGESMTSGSPTVTVSIPMESVVGETIYARIRMASAHSSAKQTLTVDVDGTNIITGTLPITTGSVATETATNLSGSMEATSGSISEVSVTSTFGSSSLDGAWLMYLALTTTAQLDMGGASSLLFRSNEQYSLKSGAQFVVSGANSSVVVWDVTDPTAIEAMATTVSGSSVSFKVEAKGSVHEYVAFDTSASYPSPTDEGAVENQNLHSDAPANYVIITTPTFREYAERLGQLHERAQGLSYRIAYVDEIYNEFAGGRAEAPAIRNYIRMLYQRGAGTADSVSYVLLLGSGSYDNYDRTSALNVIPTYQCSTPFGLVASYTSDDYYGWMDLAEGSSDTSAGLDIGIGRLCVTTAAEAEIITSKIEAYVEEPVQGDWQSYVLFLGHSGDDNEHVAYAARQAAYFEEEHPEMNAVRIFSEAYTAVTTSTGYSFPSAVAEFQSYYNSGVGMVHYTGHGSSTAISNDYMTNVETGQMTNGGKLTVMVGATCTLNAFDQRHDGFMDNGIFNAGGGFIAGFGASRESYGSGNYAVTRPFVKYAYSLDDNGRKMTLGDAMRKGKLESTKSINTVKFNLHGDPALCISYPLEQYAAIDSVNGVSLADSTESLQALALSSVSGAIYNNDGTKATDFNGVAKVTLYDKQTQRQTTGEVSGTPYSYTTWGSKLYSGEVDVVDGNFTASFILSKEFDLSVGYGHVVVYATSGEDSRDAMGSSEQILVGGFSSESLTDTIGPVIEAWVDYERDATGKVVSDNVLILYAILEDEQGINISGQGVGHDISLIVDDDRLNATTLNDYFTYETGSYTRGLVSYPLYDVDADKYTLTVKAWDNLNNSSSVTFDVNMNSPLTNVAVVDIANLVVDGNIRMTITTDALGGELTVRTQLYSIAGVKVADTTDDYTLYNGTNEVVVVPTSRNLATGAYVLRCDITSNAGNHGSFSKKIFVSAQ